MITSFLVIIFFPWVIIFFSPKATKKITHPRKKKLLTKKRSYSSNGNTFMPMIWRFYAPPPKNIFMWWKNQKTVITFDWGLLDDFWGNFWRLHFFDLFAAEIWFLVFLCFKNLKKNMAVAGGGTKSFLNLNFYHK